MWNFADQNHVFLKTNCIALNVACIWQRKFNHKANFAKQIRFKADEYTGIVLVHCHMLFDADRGMSILTEIVEKGKVRKKYV